jgi:hypothetical protein
VGKYGNILATTDGGNTWKPQQSGTGSDLYALHFAIDKAGWAAGDGGTMLNSKLTDFAPFISALNVSDSVLATVLKWRAEHKQLEQTKYIKLEFRRGEKGGWEEIDIANALSATKTGAFEVTWNPGSTPYYVNKGTTLYYRITLRSAAGTTFTHEIPKGFDYLPWWQRQNDVVKGLVIAACVIGAYLGICSLLLWLHPISLLRFYTPLQDNAGKLPSPVGPVLQIATALTFLPYFARHMRVRAAWIANYQPGQDDFSKLPPGIRADFIKQTDCLDAWVECRAARAATAFDRIPFVAQRRIYIPMPLRVGDLETGQVLTDLQPEHFCAYFQAERAVMAVIGSGGAGKSSLACQLGHWALAEDRQLRLAGHRMIPIFLEEETTDLRQSITHRLIQMVGPDEVEQDLVMSLLRYKRLLVITDALSERSLLTQRQIESIHGSVPVNALIVTTRRQPNFGPVPVTQLWPEKIEVNSLIYFLSEYLRRTDAKKFFPGRQELQLGDRLMALVERGSEQLVVTPLLIKLFVDNAISQMQNQAGLDTLPNSVPETFLAYLRRVNPQAPETPDYVANEKMIHAARVLGWCSLQEHFIPRDFSRNLGESEVRKAGWWDDKADVIARLVANGILEQHDIGGNQFLRFGLDPLAEYLAALYWVMQFKDDAAAWQEWLQKPRLAPKFCEEIRGFLVALEDCITTYRSTLGIPEMMFPWKEEDE